MPNNSSLPYPIPSPLFASQKLFVGFSPKGLSDSEISMSPTSTLETKQFSSPNSTTNNKNRQRNPPIGLGLVDVLSNDSSNNHNRLFLFGSQLKIQVPSPPQSPIDFGVKTKDSQLAPPLSPLSSDPPGSFSPEFLTDMELSEEYTCVISHGPNPKTTHIFDNCVMESCDGNFGFFTLRKESEMLLGCSSAASFLTSCHACNNNLSQGRDIFMYRGEKAFCSEECRRREMMLDDGEEKFTQDLSDLL